MCVCVLVAQSCPPMDCSPSGSSVHEILQARILEWVASSCSRDYFLVDYQFTFYFIQFFSDLYFKII